MSIRKASQLTTNNSFSVGKPAVGGLLQPYISNVIYTDSNYATLDDTAINILGGYARILGNNFLSGLSVYINGLRVSPSNITVYSTTEIRALLPATSAGTYSLMVFNNNNAGTMLYNGLIYSAFPTYTGSLAIFGISGSSFLQTFTATGDSPFNFYITSGSLPTGLVLTSTTGVLSGTPTGYVLSSTTGSFTMNIDDAQSQTTTVTVTWTITAGDIYYGNTPLLLTADTTIQTGSFLNDNSLNNLQLTPAGSVRAQSFNPYRYGYYSNYFNGSSDYLSVPNSSAFVISGDFTIEAWVYQTSSKTVTVAAQWPSGTVSYIFRIDPTGKLSFAYNTTPGYVSGSNSTASTSSITYNTWNHVVWTRSGTTIKYFINGVLDSTTNTVSGALATASTPLLVGLYNTSVDTYFNGYISNLRFVNGQSLYSTNFTPSTTPLTAITNTSLLTCQSANFVDNSTNAFAITANGTTKVTSSNPFTLPSSITVNTGYSVYFNGSTDYFTTPSSSVYAFGTGDFTVEFWINSTDTGGGCIVPANTFGSGYWGLMFNSTTLYWQSSSGVTNLWNYSASTILNGLWNHVAISRASNSSKLFINGVLVATNADSTNYTYSSSGLQIMSDNLQGANGSNVGYLSGYISNLRIVKGTGVYTSAFTPSTTPLTAITNTSLLTCQGSMIADASTNAFALTISGSPKVLNNNYPFTQPTATVSSISTLGSGYFNGSSDYLLTSSSVVFGLGTTFTIEAWVYTSNLTADSLIFDNRTTNEPGYFNINSSGYLVAATTSPSSVLTSSATIKFGAWNHIALVSDSTSTRFYINGILSGSAGQSSWPTTTRTISIGEANPATGGGAYWPGYISNLRVVKGTAVYTSNFAPSYSQLTAITNTQLLTLQSNVAHNSDTFNDSSSFNSTNLITRNGNANSGTFSPYGDNWSVYFNGSTYIQTATNTALGAGDFTLEVFIYPTVYPSVNAMLYGYRNGADTSPYIFFSSTGTLIFGGDVTNFLTATNAIVLNQWQHIVVVRSGSGTNNMSMYINGTRVAQGTSATNFSYASGSDFAVMNITSYNYTGYMSNFRTVTGTALYSGASFTVPSAPLTPVSGTGFLLFQTNRLVDNSPNPYALIITGPPQVTKFSPFSSTTITKYYSTYFDGSGYATIGTSSALNLSGTWSIEAWIYPIALTGASMSIFSNLNNGTTNGGFIFALSGATQIYITSQNPSSVTAYTTSSFTLLNNVWYHIAAVSVSGTVTFYINGVIQASTGSILSSIPNNYTNYIGGNANGSYPYRFPGYISNLRIVNGSGAYNPSAGFTPSTTPLTAITNTALLTFQNNTLIDNSTNNFIISPSTNAIKPLPYSPFSTTATNQVSYSPATFGGSIYFNGSSSYLSFPSSPITTTTDFTAEAWVYPLSQSDGTIFYFYGNSSSYAGFRFGFGTAASGFYILHSQNGTTWAVNSSTSIGGYTPNSWTHIAITRSGTSGKVFLNGLPAYTFTWGTLYAGTVNQIGSIISTSQTIFFAGYISDVRITNTALYNNTNFYPPTNTLTSTSSTISTTLLLNGTSNGIFDASRTADLESFGVARTSTFGPYNGSYYSVLFDGSTGYLSIANSTATNAAMNFSTNSFTIECWLYLSSYGGANYAPIFANQYMLYVGSAGQVLYYNGTSNVVTGSSGDVQLNVWTHLACVRNGTTVTIYVNGVSKATATVSASISYGSSFAAVIGNNSTVYLQGYISNLRVVNGTAVYTSAFTPPTSPLTTITNTSLLTCQSNKFIDNSSNTFTITTNGTLKVQTQNPWQTNTGLSYYFNGTTDYLSTPYNIQFALEASDFTIECWVFRNVAGAEHNIAVTRSAAGTDGWNLRINAANTLQFYYTGGSTLTSTGTILAGAWYYVAATRSGTSFKLYINSTLDSTATFANGTANSQALRIGVDNSNAAGFMNGYITDLRITKGVARYSGSFNTYLSPLSIK